MNKFKDNKIVFDMFYDFASFEKYIESSSENSEPVSFKSYDEYGHEQQGKVEILNRKEIKVNFEGSNEGLLDRISLKLRKKDCNYHLKDDNININRLFSEKSFEKTTERDEDFKNFIREALNMDFPNENFKYINTDKKGNVSKAVVRNNEIEELSFKNFNYVKGMDNALLEKQIKALKYNEISFLNNAFKHKFCYNLENSSNKFLKETVDKIEKQLSSQIFFANDKTIAIKNFPEEYTPKEIVQSLDGYYKVNSLLYLDYPPVLELSEEQRDLIKIFSENVSDFPPFLDFSLGNPEEVTFNLRENEIIVKKKKDFDESIDKLFPEIEIYKAIFNGDNNSTVSIRNKNDLDVIADVGSTGEIKYLCKDELEEELLIKSKEVSKYENRPVKILAKGHNIIEIKGNNISLKFNQEVMESLKNSEKIKKVNEFVKKYNLEKNFKNIECEGADFELKQKNNLKEKINAR